MIEIQQYFLYPSTLFASRTPTNVNTILGSCVAICLYDPILKIGGINHFMLPLWNGQGLASPKYGNIAAEKLIDKMLSLGSQKSNLIAKVFGGGEVIESSIKVFNIGSRNIAIAYEMLDEYKIPIVAKSVGGKFGRKIEFNSSTGEIKQRFINKDASKNNLV
jgi:chemotaxis protein CheD